MEKKGLIGMKIIRRTFSMLLILSMLLTMSGLASWVEEDAEGGTPKLTLVDDDGTETPMDSSWAEEYPYGGFALQNSELTVMEGSTRQVLTVYRLGGTTGKASAVISYQPAVAETEDGYDYLSAISADDITIMVEDALPITAYQAWGMPPEPDATSVKIVSADGVDGEGEPCVVLSLNGTADSWQWYAMQYGEWTKVTNATGAELPVSQEDLETYDFRCVFTTGGVSYCTDSFGGETYVKPAEEIVPEAPADIELNPEPTYSELKLSEAESPYSGFLFEVCFADGEYSKDILISAKNDTAAELREFATITISDCVGGEVIASMNTLMLAIEDDDEDAPAEIGFEVTEATFDKSAGTAALTVCRTGGITKAVTVNWTLESGEAVAGTDFVDASGSLYFYGAQTEQTIEIELVNDMVEDLTEKAFTVRLSGLLGDDSGSITQDACTVKLFNSNTADGLNLASTLYDVDAVDVSGEITDGADAAVSTATVYGAQVTEDDDLDTQSAEGGSSVEWFDDGLDTQVWTGYNGDGIISFSGGGWASYKSFSLSLDSHGGESTSQSVENMGSMYSSMSGTVSGGAKFSSGWYRFWHGDKEYAYTAFRRVLNGATKGWDCSPNYYKSGAHVYLGSTSPFGVSDSWGYQTGGGSLVLAVDKYEGGGSDDTINARASITLYRRAFNNNFAIELYTANDEDNGAENVAHYTTNNYANIVKTVSVLSDGGSTDGRLYEGSGFSITLGDTNLKCTYACIVNSNGATQATGSIDGKTITFTNLILPPDGKYTVRLTLQRTQTVKINVATSTVADPAASDAAVNTANNEALELMRSRSGGITFGCGTSGATTVTKSVPATQSGGFGSISGLTDIQWVDFGLPEEDLIVFNGKAYAGNEKIYLETKHLTTENMVFFYYEEDYLTAQRPMEVTIDATAVYFDGNGNGMIDGYWDDYSGAFVVDTAAGDSFIARLTDGDYEETQFQPVVSGGKVCQYFMRPYYTANPVSLVVPEGHTDSERMQVMPNFITDVTDSTVYEALTKEQKEYRTIVSGKTKLSQNAAADYSADDHVKYTAAATAYSYVDIPLGGDKSPSHAATTDHADGKVTANTIAKNGLLYYYSPTAPGNLGNAIYEWTPAFKGNLLYNFDDPQPVYITHSLAGDNIPITTDTVTWYQLSDGSFTETEPTEETKENYRTSDLGAYITENHAGEDGKAALNSYLGSFGGNDTFALAVQKQESDTAAILNGLETLADADPEKETVSRGTVGVFPNSEYLKQNDPTGNSGSADSGGQGDYEEFSADSKSELFSFSSEGLALFGVELDGYEISLSIGVPVYGKDNGGQTGSAANTFDDVGETAGKVRDFIKAIKAGSDNPFAELVGEDFDANKLKSKSIEFTVTIQLGITLKYNALDNTYKFAEAALSASVGIEVRLQYRFTPVPILYVYAQFSAEASIATGLGQDREAVLGTAILSNDEVELKELEQYYFTTNTKGFSITFDGKVYMEIFNFTDGTNSGNVAGKYDEGDTLGAKLDGTHSGYLSSDGEDATEVIIKTQDGFTLSKPVVVVLTVMDDGDADKATTATITDIALITGVEQDLYWTGFHFEIEGNVEVGIGIGIEIAKAEIFAKASIGIAFTLGNTSENNKAKCSFDEFSLSAGIGFRVVFLFFNYEQDIFEYHLQYDVDEDEDGQNVVSKSGWSHGWSALGGKFSNDSSLSTEDADSDGKIDVYITAPSRMQAQVYDNNITGASGDLDTLAFETEAGDFQVSGYGSSVNAYNLVKNVTTGYDYQIVTVGGKNYVVYTGTNLTTATTVDQTELWLSELDMTKSGDKDVYGLVNPVAGQAATASKNYVTVDGDGTGDLDFTAWADADGKTIHVVWVSYANATEAPTQPTGTPYAGMTKDNYATAAKPAGGTYVTTATPNTFTTGSAFKLNGTVMSVSNYKSMTLNEVSPAGAEPVEAAYYTTTAQEGWKSETEGTGDTAVTYYFPTSYTNLSAAREAYNNALTDYNNASASYTAYTNAKTAFDNWVLYYTWYEYYYLMDIQNQVTAASRNTVVKHATFDTSATASNTGFVSKASLSDSSIDTYYFLPQSAGSATVYAQSVPYSDSDLAARLEKYEDYLDATTPLDGSDGSDCTETTLQYLEASKRFRMNYQQSMMSVYGGNSKLTITAPDGTDYADSVMYVSKHQENGNGTAEDQTNEILTNLSVTKVGTTYYLAYVTQQDSFVMAKGAYTDLRTVSRLYLRAFTIEDNDDDTAGAPTEKIVWGDPYLLRTLVNNEQDSKDDGVYNSSLTKQTGYTDPYFSNISFLTGKLGSKLSGTPEVFETFDVAEETFLLFEMNGNTYVIDQQSLSGITAAGEGATHTGTVHPFFTYQQTYGDAIEANSTENLSSGKSEVVIGADGDGNVAAVYTAAVPNSVNNAIYIAYWDPETGTWSDGVMLAMNYMDVYESSVANGWDAATTEAAYFDAAKGGGMTQLTFSNLQIALGRSGSVSGQSLESMSDGAMQETQPTAASAYADIIGALGVSPAADDALDTQNAYTDAQMYALTEQAELLGADTGSTAGSAELLILTQGSLQKLQYTEVLNNANTKSVITPEKDSNGTAKDASVGVYAISYGKGEQQVGSASIRFAYNEFTVGSQLYAAVSFKNVGDTAIRGDNDGHPVTVKLMLHDNDGSSDTELAKWTIPQNIAPGQTVSLATEQAPCKPLAADLGTGDYFYLTVAEDTSGYVASPYSYSSDSDNNVKYRFDVEDKPELGVESLKANAVGVTTDGKATVDVSFNATNRGRAEAKDVFVQFSYFNGEYDANDNPIYIPLDLTDSELYVSQQQYITDTLTAQGVDDLANGVIYLGTDTEFYTGGYYITAARYNEILAAYYSTTSVNGWKKESYNGTQYWFDSNRFGTAYAAYMAGQEAAGGWSLDSGTGNYYNNSYASFAAAKAAADAARRMEYILTAEQYGALAEAARGNWLKDSASGEYYLSAYASHSAATAAYNAALNDVTQNIKPNYMREVAGTINVTAEKFKGKASDSFEMRVEIFSTSSNAGTNGSGMYVSDHADEYYTNNNAATEAVEQAGFISAASKIVLAQGSIHQLPVTISTTRGAQPNIRVVESVDDHDELSTLYFAPDVDTDGVAATATGTLYVQGRDIGSGVIHIIDEDTNTTYPIAYTVAEAGDGVNIFNDDTQFAFYNANGDDYDPDAANQDWKFQTLSAWTNANTEPYLGNLSRGQKGASFTFTTQASEFTFELIGSAKVTSNRFAASAVVTGNGDDVTSEKVDFGNDSGVSHTVTVTITSDEAWFDIVKLAYGEDYKPSDDPNAPGLYWSRSFPTANSVNSGESVELTVYAVDNSGLQGLTFNGAQPVSVDKSSEKMWSYTFTVTENGSFTVGATDASGNSTNRNITVDWFHSGATTDAGKAPNLTAELVKVSGATETPFASDTVITADEVTESGVYAKINPASTETTQPDFVYTVYIPSSSSFEENSANKITANGIYMVRAEATDSSGTWSARLFAPDCFESMPAIDVAQTQRLAPNGTLLGWAASKDEGSTARLDSVTLNGVSVLTGVTTQASSLQGEVLVKYGGSYVFRATDTKNVSGQKTVEVTVPVDISEDGIFTQVEAWGQPGDDGATHGSVTVDFNKVSGGNYANETGDTVPLESYYGSYKYTVIAATVYDAVASDEPSLLALLPTLAWTDAAHDAALTTKDLNVTEGGTTEYVVIICDAVTPGDYATMAVQRVTLRDNAIDAVSLSARLASGEGVADGQAYVTANKGLTGQYEFAILPEEGADFTAGGVTWQLADVDSAGENSATFAGLVPGNYLVAIRAMYSQAGSLEAYQSARQTLLDAQVELETVEQTIKQSAETKITAVSTAHSAWQSAVIEASELEEIYSELNSSRTGGNTSVTTAQVDEAYDNWQTALIAESTAENDYNSALAGLDTAVSGNILSLRAAWLAMDEGDDKDDARAAYQSAVRTAWQDYYTAQYATELSSAKTAVSGAESGFDNAADTLTAFSETQYGALSENWDGMLITKAITVGMGTETSLRAVPTQTSGYQYTNGKIEITASGGSAYDGGDTVYYQFAILPIASAKDAVDYTLNPAAIDDLGLTWHFADDLAAAPEKICFEDLPSGWYQVFVRVAYDPDPRDDLDLYTSLYNATDSDFATLRATYDAALEAVGNTALNKQVDETMALYSKWRSGGTEDDRQAYLAAIGNDADVLAAQQAWENATWTNVTETYNAFVAAIKTHYAIPAQAALEAAENSYAMRRDELAQQVATAYTETPGYYATASYTSVQVTYYYDDSQIKSITFSEDGRSVQFALRSEKLSDSDMKRIYEENRQLQVRLVLDGVTVIIPAGALTDAVEAGKVLKSFTDGTGQVVELNINGEAGVVPVSLVKDGSVSYLYMGEGSYQVAPAAAEFTDISGHWAKDNILFVAMRNLFNGIGNGEFDPEGTMTRAMLVTVLYRMAGEPQTASGAKLPFTDVAAEKWYTEAVRWAYAEGIVNGVSETSFAPNQEISREQILTILYRYLSSAGFDGGEKGDLDDYSDKSSVATYAQDAFAWGVEAGIINGVGNNLLAPKIDATRAQVAAIFERVICYILK